MIVRSANLLSKRDWDLIHLSSDRSVISVSPGDHHSRHSHPHSMSTDTENEEL